MEDQRLTVRLLNYWQMIAGVKNMPEIQQFNSTIVEDVWPHCFKVSIETNPSLSYKYEYMGRPIADVYGRDLTGLTVDMKLKQFPGSVVLQKMDEVIRTKKPLQDQGHMVNPSGTMIKYRACYLPFGSDKKGITHIITGLTFRVY